MLHVPGLYITETEKKGRGVFTLHPLQKGDLIELCPIIILPNQDRSLIDKTFLYHYYFLSPQKEVCIVLGYGSIYNHSSQPNAEIMFDTENQKVEIHCIETVEKCGEILINYTGELKDAPELWFEEA